MAYWGTYSTCIHIYADLHIIMRLRTLYVGKRLQVPAHSSHRLTPPPPPPPTPSRTRLVSSGYGKQSNTHPHFRISLRLTNSTFSRTRSQRHGTAHSATFLAHSPGYTPNRLCLLVSIPRDFRALPFRRKPQSINPHFLLPHQSFSLSFFRQVPK